MFCKPGSQCLQAGNCVELASKTRLLGGELCGNWQGGWRNQDKRLPLGKEQPLERAVCLAG